MPRPIWEVVFRARLEDPGLGGGKGGIIPRAQQKKDFGAIPYFLVIADYDKVILYVAPGQFLSDSENRPNRLKTLKCYVKH